MKAIGLVLLVCSVFCTAQFFDEYSDESTTFFESTNDIKFFKEMDLVYYEEPDFGTDQGQPGDPNGVPINQFHIVLILSGMFIYGLNSKYLKNFF